MQQQQRWARAGQPEMHLPIAQVHEVPRNFRRFRTQVHEKNDQPMICFFPGIGQSFQTWILPSSTRKWPAI